MVNDPALNDGVSAPSNKDEADEWEAAALILRGAMRTNLAPMTCVPRCVQSSAPRKTR